jgi:hypothetical protein
MKKDHPLEFNNIENEKEKEIEKDLPMPTRIAPSLPIENIINLKLEDSEDEQTKKRR